MPRRQQPLQGGTAARFEDGGRQFAQATLFHRHTAAGATADEEGNQIAEPRLVPHEQDVVWQSVRPEYLPDEVLSFSCRREML